MREEKTEQGIRLREYIQTWDMFLESFGYLLPGGMGIYEVGDKVRPLYHSPGAVQLCYGFDEDFFRVASQDVDVMLMKNENARLQKAIGDAMEHGGMLDCTLRYRRTPRQDGWIWVRGKIHERNRRRRLFVGILLDVTQNKRIEQELMVQNKRYRILEETTNEILFEVQVAEDVMTYSYKEMDGEMIRRRIPHYSRFLAESSMVHPDYQEIFMRHLEMASKKNVEGQLEYLSRISGKGYEWHRLHYTTIEDYSGKVQCIIGRVKNIHDEVLRRQKNKDDMDMEMAGHFGIQQGIRNRLENVDMEGQHAMAIVEIDSFKKITDQNGVAWGDAAMHKLNDIIQEITESKAIMGILSGGKMLVYMSNISETELDREMEEILSIVDEKQIKVANIHLNCNIGAATVQGIADYSLFFQEVEEALHIAKITKGERYIRG